MCFWTAENESKNTREMFYDHFIVTIEQSQLNDKYICIIGDYDAKIGHKHLTTDI